MCVLLDIQSSPPDGPVPPRTTINLVLIFLFLFPSLPVSSFPPLFIHRPYADGDTPTSHDHPHVAHRCARSPSSYSEALTTTNLLHTISPRPAFLRHAVPGFDGLMPEGRRAPWKYLPRPGAHLSVTFGSSLAPAAVRAPL
ncbi:hypothetical protein BC827DRAFT_131866 [Russula dissimulans]|nr:hypothetical protein BC827DRAFT_131866 [Russula dissimulans]